MSLFSVEEDRATEVRRRQYLAEHPEDKVALRYENARLARILIAAARDFPEATVSEFAEHSGRPASWVRRALRKAGIVLEKPARPKPARRAKPKVSQQAAAIPQAAVAKGQATKLTTAQYQRFGAAHIATADTASQATPAATGASAAVGTSGRQGFVYQVRSPEQWEARMQPRRTRQARRKLAPRN